MGTRSKAADEALLNEIRGLKQTMLTKEYFDQTMKPINDKLSLHDTQISEMDERLTAVERTKESYTDAVYTEMHEQEKRKNSLVIFKLNEQNQQLAKKQIFKKERDEIIALFTDMKLVDTTGEIANMRISRVGVYGEGKTRPVRVMLRDPDVKNEILSHAKNLKGINKWKNVSISCDLTKTQQKLAKKKRNEFKSLVDTKNAARTTEEINQGVEYKVVGNYGRFNLRMVKFTNAPLLSDSSSDEQD